jgi:hypothetical protein
VERRSLTGAQMDAIVRAAVAEREAAARRAGLVTRWRRGRRVIYTRTATGDDLRAHH